jgi:hypothetical protein
MVVEITPIGIEKLGWQFYVIWTVFNTSFVPIVYLFYPETSDRTLEDIDRLFRENSDIFIFRDKNAIAAKRPAAYFEKGQTESGMKFGHGFELADSKLGKDVHGNGGVMVDHEEGAPAYGRRWDEVRVPLG